MLTSNEKQVLRWLAVNPRKDYSINEIARFCHLTPNGAYKLLAKLEKEQVLKAKSIANIKSYKLNFNSEKTDKILELSFMQDITESRMKNRIEDFQPLKAVTRACIFFGSYITAKKKPEDLDVLLIIDQVGFEGYKQALAKVQERTPLKIQDIIQTTKDLEQNLKKEDPIIGKALQKGIVIWGFDVLVQAIKNAAKQN
ncbi:MAG TPA: hypothetical protein VJG90_02070 [Candidatus Nanoarchaeia archaeon]|nr:hypothetical protein [Candidatus Nanoarchaeia archaeon]